jgi:hypothetical protein
MNEIYEDPLDPASEAFQRLCIHLDSSVRRDNATCSVDLFSGGFKFSDEAPPDYEKLADSLPPFVDLMRCLWGYRASIVAGKPRQDLAAYWEAARRYAPGWAGFSPERASEEMKIHLDEAARRTTEFIKEMDLLDRSLSKSRASA